MKAIDINNSDYLEYGKPENNIRTTARLTEIRDMGMIDYGNQQFGIDGLMSGLYIEMVWRYSEENWNGYLNWVRELKNRKLL